MTKPILALTFIYLAILPTFAMATEWVECSNENYTIEFLANPTSTEIIEFVFSVEGVRKNTSEWVIKKREINFETRSISFEATTPHPPLKSITLESQHKNGVLTYENMEKNVFCDWSLFFE